MPDRLLTPRRASYVMIAFALAVVVLAVWNVRLSNRVGVQEAIRRSEGVSARARAASECRARIAGTQQINVLLASLRDLATIPQMNLETYLATDLDAKTRAAYENALGRYRGAVKRFHPYPIPRCVRTDP